MELNVRGTGGSEMAALREWFDALWEDSEDISQMLAVEHGALPGHRPDSAVATCT